MVGLYIYAAVRNHVALGREFVDTDTFRSSRRAVEAEVMRSDHTHPITAKEFPFVRVAKLWAKEETKKRNLYFRELDNMVKEQAD